MIAADNILLTVPHGYRFHVYIGHQPAYIWDLPNAASLDLAGMPRAELRKVVGYRQAARRRRSNRKAAYV